MIAVGDSKFLFNLPGSVVINIGVLNANHASSCKIDVSGAVVLELGPLLYNEFPFGIYHENRCASMPEVLLSLETSLILNKLPSQVSRQL